MKGPKSIAAVLKRSRDRHQQRHSPSGFEFVLSDRISFLNQADWQTATKDSSLLFSPQYLRVLEAASPENVRPLYSLIYKDNVPSAALCFQAVTVSGRSIPRIGRSKLETKFSLALGALEQQILVCGNLLCWGNHGVAIASEASGDVWHGIAEAIYRVRRSQKLFGDSSLVLLKDHPPTGKASPRLLATYSYRYFPTEPNMRLTVSPKWKSFDDYLATLKGDYRKSVRKLLKDVDSAGYYIESLTPREVHSNRQVLYDLYREVLVGQKLRLVSLSPDYLPALSQEFGDKFATLILRASGGEIAGFVTVLHDVSESIAYYIGFSRKHAEQVPVYLRLMYAATEECIRHGASSISFGRTALEPKARLGCKPEPVGCFARHRVPAMNLLLQGLMTAVPEPHQPPVRHPFKE